MFQPPSPGLRASDADRERTVDRLRVAAEEGRLDHDELEERIAAAYAARYCTELAPLVADVTPPPAVAGPPVFVRRNSRTNPLAVVSLVSGLFVFVWWWIAAVVAIVTGHRALRQIARSGGAQTGRAAALVGLCLGYFGFAAMLMFGLAVFAIG